MRYSNIIYLVTGLMASGKSTVANLLASRLDRGVHLRGDIFRRMVVSGREEMSATPSPEAIRQLHLRYRLAVDAAKTYYDNGFSVVLQDNYYGPDLLYVVNRLRDYPVRVVVLCPTVEVIEEREASRGKKGYIGFSIESLHVEFMTQTPRLGFWLDTSELTPEQSVNEILNSQLLNRCTQME